MNISKKNVYLNDFKREIENYCNVTGSVCVFAYAITTVFVSILAFMLPFNLIVDIVLFISLIIAIFIYYNTGLKKEKMKFEFLNSLPFNEKEIKTYNIDNYKKYIVCINQLKDEIGIKDKFIFEHYGPYEKVALDTIVHMSELYDLTNEEIKLLKYNLSDLVEFAESEDNVETMMELYKKENEMYMKREELKKKIRDN